MQVNNVEKHEDGSATVTSDLTPEQLTFLVNLGINVVMRAGARQIGAEQSTKEEPKIVV